MSNVNANINVNIDTRAAQAQLAALQQKISAFNKAVAASNMAGSVAATAMSQQLLSSVGQLGKFSTSIRSMDTEVNRLAQSFDRGTLSARQYFRYAASAVPGLVKGFRSLQTEQTQMTELARDRVKRLGTQYVDLGKDINGVRKVMALRPDTKALNDFANTTAMAQQRMQLMNRALQLGSTGLVNWGKNTQWAGRQLMVGFTVPLMIAAGAAAKFYMEIDKASMQFRRVYGDLDTSTQEVERNLAAVKELGVEYTKFGVAVKDTIDLSARVAATGAQNEDLMAGTEQTLRLATLGQMEYNEALDAVTSLQTAFAISAEDLGNKINFLNAVENQTVLTMEDMARAVPRVAPVIKGLGGDVEDLAVFMTALREGGVSAEQGANALKSGLASLINPTTRAQETLEGLGINIKEIVQANKGDLMGTVKAFGQALNSLNEFERQQALETVFGKYQYARLGALFKNIANDSSQAARAMDIAGQSTSELAQMAERELGIVSETVTNKFLGAVERLKVAIAPIGEFFLLVITPIVNAVSAIANAFNDLPEGIKKAVGIATVVIGGIAPVALMVFGLLGNALGNTIKFFGFLGKSVVVLASLLRGQGVPSMKWMASAELDAVAAATALDGATDRLTSSMLLQTSAVQSLSSALGKLASSAGIAGAAMSRAASVPVIGGIPGRGPVGRPPIKMATGGMVPGTGNGDTVPALLTPGESVITKEATAKYGPVLAAMNAGTLQGFNDGIVPGKKKKNKEKIVYAHGNPNIPITDEQRETLRKDNPRLAQKGVKINYGLSNFAFMMPESFNKQQMSGKKAAKYFTGKNVDRTMLPIYKAIARQMSQDLGKRVTTKDVMNDPVIRKDVRAFAKNIGTDLAQMGARAVKNEDFYAITEKASKQTPFQNPASSRGIEASKRMTTVSVSGGPYTRKGGDGKDKGERQGVSKRVQKQLGSPTPMASFKDDQEIKDARQTEKKKKKDAKALSDQEKRQKAAIKRMKKAGMSQQQIDRMMRKYGSRISPPTPPTSGAGVLGGMADPDDPNNRPQPAKRPFISERTKVASARAQIARRQFRGSLSGLGAVILNGPVADIQKFAAGEAKTFANQIKGGLKSIKRGLAKIATPIAESGAMMVSRIPNDPGAAMSGAARRTVNRVMDTAIPGAFKAMDRGATALKKMGSLASDMGQAIRYRDFTSATKILVNAIGGTETVKRINDARNRLTESISKAGQTVVEAGKHITAAYGGANSLRDAAAMTSKIIGTTKVYDSIKANALAAGQTIKTFTSAVGERVRDVRVMFREQGFRAATVTASEAVGLNKAIRGVRDSLVVGKDAIVKTAKSIPDATLRGFDKALGGYKTMKQGFSSTIANLGTSMSNMALQSFDRALGGWKGMKDSFAGVGSAVRTAGIDGAKAIGTSLKSAALRISDSVSGMFRSGGIDPVTGQAAPSRFSNFMTGGKMAGAGMGLAMASMIPFMNADAEGKFMGMNANMLGMGMMGGGMLMSMAPMIGGPATAAIAALSAAGVALYAWRNNVDTAARAASDFGSNLGGAANALNNMAAMMGKMTPAQKQTQMRLGFTETEKEMAFGEFQNMFNTPEGQKFIEDLKSVTSAERFEMLSQYIKTAVSAGLMDPGIAPAFAKTVSMALEDSFLGAAVVNSLRDGIERGSAGLLDLARERNSQVQGNAATQNVSSQQEVSFEDSAVAIGASFQVIQDFSNAAALAREEYINGSISYQQYISVLDEATAAQAKYSSILSDAITKTSDIGATAQALQKQLTLLLSPAELEAVNAASQIDIDWDSRIADTVAQWGDTLASVLLGAITGKAESVNWLKDLQKYNPFLSEEEKLGDEDRKRIESQTRAFMAEAIVSGMNAATVSAIQQYIKENPESQAAEAFGKYESMGGAAAYRAAGMAANIEVLGLPGDLESIMSGEEYIEIAMKFMEEGGTVEDFEAFINSIPEEKSVDVMLAFKGMSPEDQIKFISSFQNLSNLLGAENAQKIDDILLRQAAATRTSVPTPGVPGATTTTTLGEQKTGIEQQITGEQEVLARQKASGASQDDIAKTEARIASLQTQLEEVTGKIYEIKMQLDPSSQQAIEEAMALKAWDEDTTTLIIEVLLRTEGNLEELPQYAEWASELSQLPEEVRTILAIDTASLPDLQQFGPQAEGLVEGVSLIEALPEDVDKQLAFSMMVDENGKVKTPKQILASTRSLQKDFSKIADIPDSKLRKQMIFELMQQVTDENGEQISEDAFQQRYQDLVDRYGQQVISNLPPDVLFKAIMFDYNADQLTAEAAAIRTAAARLANIGGAEAQVAKMLEEAAAMEEAASALSGMSSAAASAGAAANYGGTSPGGSGGDSGGGGGGEEDPLEAMIKDLETQEKLVGNYAKKEGEISRGFATALRKAGTPEYLIAEIISKGADGIKIAKKLLADKKKKLQELMKLSLEVARMTLIEQNRAAANNFRTQANAQNYLLGAGIDPSTAMDIASDPEQAAAVADSYKRIQDAQRKLENAKGEDKKKKARKELQDAKKDWDQLTESIKNATRAQIQFNINSGVKAQTRVEGKALGIQSGALTRLMTQGFTFEQAQEFAGDEMISGAIVAAGRAADAAARRVDYLTKKKKELEDQNKKGSKQWKRVRDDLIEARKQSDILSNKYKALIADLEALTKAQKNNLVTNTIAEYKGLTSQLGMQQNILQKLIDSGMSYAQAIEIASDPQKALAFAAALEKQDGSFESMVAQAQALEAATAKFSLNMKMAEFGDAIKKQGFRGAITALTSGNPLGGMVSDYLMGLSTAELTEFFNQTPEWRQQFVSAFLDSIPLAEKIKYLFDQINAAQQYQSLLNRDKANADKQNIDTLDDQLKAQKKLLEVEQDKLKAVQDSINVIQEENDDYERGLDLINRQEDKINEAFDQRIDALDDIEQANSRIAQQQQNQLNLSQALAQGDIYAATQAAQQIKQENAAAAIENTRDAMDKAREEQLSNLMVEVNGKLLTREQIEKRIESNNDRIYQLQEDQLEPLQAAIDKIQDQIDKIEDAKNAWQDYYDYLEKNAVDPFTGMKYSDLQRVKEYYDRIVAANPGMSAEQAFGKALQDYVNAGGKIQDETKLRAYFGITPGKTTPAPPPTTGTTPGTTPTPGTTSPPSNVPNPQELADSSKPPSHILPENYMWQWDSKNKKWGFIHVPPGTFGNVTREQLLNRNEPPPANSLPNDLKWVWNNNFMRWSWARKFAGGEIMGSGATDSVPTLTAPGEFVVRRSMVKKYGLPMFEKINQGSFDASFQTPSEIRYNNINRPVEINSSPTMYNNTYSINVTANTNASADEIASVAVMKIRQMDSMRIRGARG